MANFSLLFCVVVIATCGLIYELIAATLASYLLGDSITQFSTIIGTYLFSMGIGSYVSRFFTKKLLEKFVVIEILVGFLGGILATILFLIFNYVAEFQLVLYFFVSAIGILVGLEIPILLNILKDELEFKDLISKVLALDYVGGLAASLIFPFFLVPKLGLVSTSFLFGTLNSLVALWSVWIFRNKLETLKSLAVFCSLVVVSLLVGLVFSEKINDFLESHFYSEEIFFTQKTHYQKLTLTSHNDEIKLYINGNLQFDSVDEYRYHEALILPALQTFSKGPKKILILGGGDGLAAREILKHSEPEQITLVDLDPKMTEVFSQVLKLVELNEGSLLSEKVKIINQDAFVWVRENTETYDLIVCDFPDPSNFSLGKLYSQTFYEKIKQRLSENGTLVVQSTSPKFARKSFWCIAKTIEKVGFSIKPYHIFIPSFGEWGFVLASKNKLNFSREFPQNTKFFNREVFTAMFLFPKDISFLEVETNKLNNQILVSYYTKEEEETNALFH
ncbi:polyamine aminopropyltransferase [bacterium]|nr:polyamine aminopropyltransferase [bacterium]